jgi:hypothetical protein
METIKFFKVTSLPAVLEPNSMYLVNTAGILSIHISDNTGLDSIQLSGSGGAGGNGGLIPFPVRKETPKIAGDNNLYPLTTQAVVTRRFYVFPFVTPRTLTTTNLRISTTAQAAGTVSVGIYNNIKIANGNDNPYQLLASVSGLSTANPTGNKDAALAFTFEPNTLYWIGFVASSAPTVRAINVYSMASSLGRTVSANTGPSHLYKDYATFALPALAPTDLLSAITSVPAVYLVE